MDLSNFHGSEVVYRHALSRKVYTEGAKYVADQAGAYWLLDSIALSGVADEFQVWKLDTKNLTLVCEDGDGGVLKTERLTFTDFPDPGITLWCIDGTILLPSEY